MKPTYSYEPSSDLFDSLAFWEFLDCYLESIMLLFCALSIIAALCLLYKIFTLIKHMGLNLSTFMGFFKIEKVLEKKTKEGHMEVLPKKKRGRPKKEKE